MLKPHFEPNCAFCDTSIKCCTRLVWPIRSYLKTGPQPDLACGGGGSHFQNGWHEFSMSHISANNVDNKLIIVSISMFSGSRNPNVAIIWVCGGCGSHFQNGRHEFSMSHISANNIDRKLICVSFSLLSESQNPNMAIILKNDQWLAYYIYPIWLLWPWKHRHWHQH